MFFSKKILCFKVSLFFVLAYGFLLIIKFKVFLKTLIFSVVLYVGNISLFCVLQFLRYPLSWCICYCRAGWKSNDKGKQNLREHFLQQSLNEKNTCLFFFKINTQNILFIRLVQMGETSSWSLRETVQFLLVKRTCSSCLRYDIFCCNNT